MMNFQSDNAEIKRPKHSLSPITNEIKQNEEEDIISRLPDEILAHILSLLPDDADAYRTRILSNRWNHLFFFLPSLCFKMPFPDDQSVEDINKFHDFVDRTLAHRDREGGDMPIKRFFLYCPHEYDYNRVLDCLLVVVRSKVEILELRFSPGRYRFCLSWDLFTTCNNTLVELTLQHVTMLLAVDDTRLIFPCLKTIKLESVKHTGNQSPENLIPACPVLQDLCLKGQKFRSRLHTFNISSPSLKRLRIEWCSFRVKVREVVIDTPKLEYLYIDTLYHKYSLTNPSCLVEAHIETYSDSSDIQVFTSVSSARILTLTSGSLLGLSRNEGLNLPVFPNLVKLIVDFQNISKWDLLFIFLNSMPNLQHITISFGYHSSPFKRRWNPPMEAPACLWFMVKEIVILNEYAVQVKDHVTLITYLLSHSSVLEKLTLSTFDIDCESREKLLKICRRSKTCRIEFV